MGWLDEPFLQRALAAAILCGTLCAFLGVYIHLKRIVFLGIALSEAAALGVASGLLLGIRPELSASVLTVLAALIFGTQRSGSTLTREGILGLLYCLTAALAVILLSANPMAEAHGVDLVSGNLLYVSSGEIAFLSVLTAAVFVVHLTLFRRLIFVSFDPETARTLGWNVRPCEFLLFLTLGLSIAACMKITGVLFVFGCLVIPPMTGLVSSRRVSGVFLTSVGAAVLAAAGGLWASLRWDVPTGPTMVCVQGALFLLSILFRPR